MAKSIDVVGDLFDQDVEVIVNAWNANLIPWWLLLPSGVSGSLRKRAGPQVFRELSKSGWLRPGMATLTGAGRLGFLAVIHVAGLNLFWRSSETIVRGAVRSALTLAATHGYKSVAFPLIGSGVGGLHPDRVAEVMHDEISHFDYGGRVVIVRYM